MTPSATQVNPVNAVSAPAATQQQATTTSDIPFSQVLSSEIGQHQRNAEVREADRDNADSKDTPASDGIAEAHAGPALRSGETPAAADDAKDAPETESTASDAPILPVMPDTLMALAMQLDLLKSLPADKTEALPATSVATGANPVLFDAPKNTLRILPASQAIDVAAGAAKSGAGLTTQPDAHTVPPNPAPTVTAAFAGQLAAARLSDALKADDSSPAMLIPPSFGAMTERINFSAPPLPHAAANMLAPSVGTTAWGQALSDKLIWMTTGALQTASLTLNPPDLGPLQIVLNLTHDQATASFFATQPEVRQALEAALPKLREMMHQAGIQLGQTTISADTPPQQDTPGRQAHRFTPPFAAPGDISVSSAGPLPVVLSGRGLVDTFA
jgi:flagellar hook-length control protein FliK